VRLISYKIFANPFSRRHREKIILPALRTFVTLRKVIKSHLPVCQGSCPHVMLLTRSRLHVGCTSCPVTNPFPFSSRKFPTRVPWLNPWRRKLSLRSQNFSTKRNPWPFHWRRQRRHFPWKTDNAFYASRDNRINYEKQICTYLCKQLFSLQNRFLCFIL